MADVFTLNADDFTKVIDAIRKTPENAERTINQYLHGEAADMLVDSITKYIPVSTGRYAAHRNLQKTYKHKKSVQHARYAKWYLAKNYNLALTINNQNDYYYLYFVEHGLGTSSRSGGVDFAELGINSVYDRIINGMIDSISKEDLLKNV